MTLYFGSFEYARYDYAAVGHTKEEVEAALQKEYLRQRRASQRSGKNEFNTMPWKKWKEYSGCHIKKVTLGEAFQN